MEKARIKEYFNKIAYKRDKWKKRNWYYYQDLVNFLRSIILPNSRILEIGCGTGDFINQLNPSCGVGIDISEKMIEIAQNKYPQYIFKAMDAENLELNEKYDYIIMSDLIGHLTDIQRAFLEIRKVITPKSRVIITYYSFIWEPAFRLLERLRLKMPQYRQNWLSINDISNLLDLANFDIIRVGKRFLIPKKIPLISDFFNKYISKLPLINRLCIIEYIIARAKKKISDDTDYSVSIIVPARNEKGNIENVVKRIPRLGDHTEIIFVEGHSTDGTYEEIERVCYKYKGGLDLKYIKQDGKGKGDAVKKGFSMAKGDILIILDADLTVPAEDITKFYDVLASDKGEFANGCRLIYPLEKESMRFMNIIGNKFFSVLFTWLLEQKIKDTLCGTKALFREDYIKISENRKYFGDFDPFGDFDLLFGAAKLNLKITEVPIRYRAREYGQTNISRWKHGWLLLRMSAIAMKKLKFV